MATPKLLVKREGKGANAPFVVTPEGLKVLEAMAAEGCDQRTMAKRLGMRSHSTLRSMAERDDAVAAVIALGHAQLADELTHHLLAAARKGNVIAAIYLTKARLGWRDGGETQAVKPNVTIVLPDAATPEAYLRMVAEQNNKLLPPIAPKGIALQPPPIAAEVVSPKIRYADDD
jgi:hypothetical protein